MILARVVAIVSRPLTRLVFRPVVSGVHNLPRGGFVLSANHLSGYDGFALAYNKLQGPLPEPSGAAENPSITKVTYERENVESVDSAISGAEAYLENLLTTEGTEERISVGVFMIDTYQPSNKFIRAVKDWINDDETRASALDLLFINVSFVGSDALAQTLSSAPSSYVDITDPDGARTKTYAEGVMVTQVVPNYTSQAQGVREYRADIDALDNGTYSFTSLEGYIASSLFVEGLRRHGANISAYDSGSLVDTFDSEVVDLDLKIGTLLNFSSTNHQASHTVWGSVIGADGTFTIPFMWNNEQGIIAGQN